MDLTKEENKNIDDVKVTIGGREIKGITSMKYEDSNKIIILNKIAKPLKIERFFYALWSHKIDLQSIKKVNSFVTWQLGT